MAAQAGVTIVLEPLHKGECNIVTTVGEGTVISVRLPLHRPKAPGPTKARA